MQQRYYDPQMGRFLSTDPVASEETTGDNFNRYWYARNSPLLLTDPDGRWSPQAHDKLLYNALVLKGLSTADIKKVQQSSRDFDTRTQAPEDSNKHSMAKEGQSGADALKGRDKFIGETMVAARKANETGDRDKALKLFGEAMHPVMDSASPMHTTEDGKPREWTGMDTNAVGHSPTDWLGNETSSDITSDVTKSQNARIGAAYDWVFKARNPDQ
jgi:uncharacterized protein RhaS with RHS repeats